jgi:GDPmannose 4,6-dehydratase
MKKAFITGITGQDGAYLSKNLLDKGYKVYGGIRRNSTRELWRLERLGISQEIEFIDFDLLEQSNIQKTIKELKVHEFYNLAAQSFVGVSFSQPIYTSNVTGLSVLYILDALKKNSPNTRFYQASTSEMFGKVQEIPQNEETNFHPRSPYGNAKLFAHWATINYRESYDMFCSSGILFNHESPLRGSEFVTRKIIQGLVAIQKRDIPYIELGNLDAKRDWGFAEDYCDGMVKILNHTKPDTFVLATGETRSIKEFINKSCSCLGMEPEYQGEGADSIITDKKTGKIIIRINPKFFRPCEVDLIIGDASKAKRELGWEPKTSFSSLVEHMIEEEIKYYKET